MSDFVLAHPRFEVLPDPFDLVDVLDPGSAASFHEQLIVAAQRLIELPSGVDVIAERGPLDFLAYLEALVTLGRATVAREVSQDLRMTTAAAIGHVDLLVVLPLAGVPDVWVPDEEDPRLRTAMDQHLLELCDDDELLGALARVVELVGSPKERLPPSRLSTPRTDQKAGPLGVPLVPHFGSPLLSRGRVRLL